MIFTTHWYLFFAAFAVGIFWLLPNIRARWSFLALACVVFHVHFAGPAGVLPIVILMIVTYFSARSKRPWACGAAIVICVVALAFYKYVFFLISAAVAPLHPSWAESLTRGAKSVMPGAPPLAISFFTFELVHYLYEVEKGGEPIRSPVKFLLFAIFFPSLVAGPIKRYTQFLPSADDATRRQFKADDLAAGLARVAVGFFKKVVIADTLTAYIDITQPRLGEETIWIRWIFLMAIAFRILLDFSGYSDIAIGTARLLGIHLPENFNWPYLAVNLREFWQRWHISLSSWIRDYVYIPLGGNRHGPVRRVLNGLIAFALCGLWHGAAWNFVLWGLFHGLGLLVSSSYERLPRFGRSLSTSFKNEPAAAWALTQFYVWSGWLLFFYPASEALRNFKLLFGLK